MHKRVPLLIILVFPIFVCAMAWYFWYSPVTTIVLVRHAERLNDSDTTSISEVGIQRAHRLAYSLGVAGVNRIYVSQKKRTRQTAEPTAEALNIHPIEIPANEIRRYADSVKAHRGDAILIVGHSDTVPQIIGKLGIKNPPPIPAGEFDNLFIVNLHRFRSTLTHLKY
jgi:broad specificity phosphatase PhoE